VARPVGKVAGPVTYAPGVRALVQRVSEASVAIGNEIVGQIGTGLCALIGVASGDSPAEADRMAAKLWQLRIFADDAGTMNRSAAELGLPLLVISQFTLYADTSRGRRPSFVKAAPPVLAEPLVRRLVDQLRSAGAQVATGRFGATMQVRLTNDGPVTVMLEV
jgi:D-tyrosyl-tRNA(Tyr) deacylase